jgi:hypothetical protein
VVIATVARVDAADLQEVWPRALVVLAEREHVSVVACGRRVQDSA